MKQLKIAELTGDGMKKVKILEEHTGFHIMAFEPGFNFATPGEEQLDQIQALEQELGVTLLAYLSE